MSGSRTIWKWRSCTSRPDSGERETSGREIKITWERERRNIHSWLASISPSKCCLPLSASRSYIIALVRWGPIYSCVYKLRCFPKIPRTVKVRVRRAEEKENKQNRFGEERDWRKWRKRAMRQVMNCQCHDDATGCVYGQEMDCMRHLCLVFSPNRGLTL